MSAPKYFLLLAAFAAAAQTPYEVGEPQTVMVPMRDGVKLGTDVYRPLRNGVPVEGKFSVILVRTPYNKNGDRITARTFVPQGYILVAQDVRESPRFLGPKLE